MGDKNDIGKIGWFDLTVADAPAIRDFYSKVAGWKPENVSMGEYDDFNMTMPETDEPAAGICHARGENAELPSQWLIYITVADVDESAEACRDNGGTVIVGPKSMGGGKFCVIQDPNGSVAALYQAG
jgi:predicted enzyme related to lactoylglutathione lyase